MNGLAPEESARYLAAVAELKSSCRLYDMHVHPYEVLFDRFSYQASDSLPGVLNMPGKTYAAPSTGALRFPEIAEFGNEPQSQRLLDVSVMLMGRIYGSVGPRVFLDHMKLSGLDRVLLLPVASENADAAHFDARMAWIRDLYGDDERFCLAGSIPAGLEGAEIERYAASLKERFAVKAIKCHPVVSGIDLGTSQRKAWLETLVEACHRQRLPLIIHAGRNNPYWGGSRGDFGSLRHLREIDFSLSHTPVVLAHAGMHRCPLREMELEALPVLKDMLNRHHNLYVDISGLGFEQLKLVFSAIDEERILFGSDALYAPQWEVAATTAHALHAAGMKWEESFIRFAGKNPEKIIFDWASSAQEGQIKPQPLLKSPEFSAAFKFSINSRLNLSR